MAGPTKTQVLNSTTFVAPPLEDKTLALPDLYDWQHDHSPEHPLFHYEDSPGNVKTIRWAEGVRAIHRAARLVAALASPTQVQDAIEGRPTVIATLAATDTITYLTTELGILRTGFAVFPISPRNSPDAIAHLLKVTNVRIMLVSGEPMLQKLAQSSLALLKQSDIEVPMFDMPSFADVYPSDADPTVFERYPAVKFDSNAPALIMHSSGSTSYPKAIPWAHNRLVTLCDIPWQGGLDLCGLVMSCHAMPVFHGMGLLQIGLIVSTGVEMAVFKPAFPAVIPNPQNVLEGMMATKCVLAAAAPTFLETWSRNPTAIAFFKTTKALMWGGGSLPKQVGDKYTSEGIAIHSQYGCTECGVMSTFVPAQGRGEDWEYFKISGHCLPEPIPQGDGSFELVLVDHDGHHPVVFNTEVNGRKAYATSDLLLPHPTKAGLWKVYGRKDDQIMLSTGEKTNPGPLEGILNQDPHVLSAVMFGRGKFQNGMLIDPKPAFAFDPSDEQKLEEFRNAIWPTVEKMNAFAPQHSRLFKEMILVAVPSKPFTYTAKMTARRQAILKDYETEIETLYEVVAESSQVDVPFPAEWTASLTLDFVHQVVVKVMDRDVPDDVDIFQHGCDSLQSTWIRNSLLRALRTTSPAAAKTIPSTFVYEHPTVERMAIYITNAVRDPTADQTTDLATRGKELQTLLDGYLSDLPARPTNLARTAKAEGGEVYLVTGTTGSVGSNILVQLLASPSVTRVYAFNRPSKGSTSAARHRATFDKRGLDASLLDSSKLVYVEGDLNLAFFGLDWAIYEEMQKSTTHIVHNAWRINLNLSLMSFDDSVKGVRKLVDFAITSPRATPPRFLFVSSIAVFIHFENNGYVEERELADPTTAVGTGYSESKWLAERILDGVAAKPELGLSPRVVRLGQISGDKNGTWAETEWFPSIVQSGSALGCLPVLDGVVSWILSSDAASALIEISRAAPTSPRTLHIAHPRPVPFKSLIAPIARAMGVPLVPWVDWLVALSKAPEDLPAARLLAFYQAAPVGPNWEPVGVARLGTTQSISVSETLRVRASPLTVNEVRRWVEGWRKIGFLPEMDAIEEEKAKSVEGMQGPAWSSVTALGGAVVLGMVLSR